MSLFSKKQPHEKIELVCDIGSGSIAASLVSFREDVAPSVLFAERLEMSPDRTRDHETILSAMDQGLSAILGKVFEFATTSNIKPTKAYCFYCSPWFLSQSQTVKINPSKPTVFSKETLTNIIATQEKTFNQKLFADADMSVIERKVTAVRLNGYETHDPFGKTASSIEVSLFVSALEKKVLNATESAIKHFWSVLSPEHHTFPSASFFILRNLIHANCNFAIIDISGEVTDISLANNNMLCDTMSYPLGKHNIVRRVTEECAMDYEIAHSAISLSVKKEYKEDELKLKNAIIGAQKDWFTHLDKAFGDLLVDKNIPSMIYVIADEEMVAFFTDILNTITFTNQALSGNSFQVIPMKHEALDKYINYKATARKDFFISSEVIYLEMFESEKHLISSKYVLD